MKTDIFTRAADRARALGIRNVLVATNTGKSVETAQEIMGVEFSYFAVGNPSTSRDKGWVYHEGITRETRERLERKGITVVTQQLSIFQCAPGRDGDQTSFRQVSAAYLRRFGGAFGNDETAPNNVCKVMRQIIGEFFGDGPCVCMEITLMAADSGRLPLDQDCIAIATPGGYSHAAMVIHPVRAADLFSTHFRVKDMIISASENDIWFNDGPIP